MGFEKTDVLLQNLTRKLGLPLDEIVSKGKLPPDIAAKMGQNCKNCTSPARCEDFLAVQPDTIAAPPSFCVNCRLLTFLSKNLPTDS
jgi:hypothetical protein